MPVPENKDMLDEAVSGTSDDEVANLICQLDHSRTDAAYWQGLYEGQSITLAYLKDRLDQIERRKPEAPVAQA